jgi:hypothetical protein
MVDINLLREQNWENHCPLIWSTSEEFEWLIQPGNFQVENWKEIMGKCGLFSTSLLLGTVTYNALWWS